jgi:hypothetical protein
MDIRFHCRLKTRATWPTETKAQMCQTACPDISETVIPILGVSKCLETLKVRVVHRQKRKQKRKKPVRVNMCPETSGFLVSLKNYIQK